MRIDDKAVYAKKKTPSEEGPANGMAYAKKCRPEVGLGLVEIATSEDLYEIALRDYARLSETTIGYISRRRRNC